MFRNIYDKKNHILQSKQQQPISHIWSVSLLNVRWKNLCYILMNKLNRNNNHERNILAIYEDHISSWIGS